MKEYIQKFDPRKYMNTQDFEIFHYRGSIPEEKEVHHHDFYEIFFLIDGKVAYWSEGQTYNLSPGDILLINPMVLHRPIPDENISDYDRIVLWINKDYLEELSQDGAELFKCFENSVHKNMCLLHTDGGQMLLMKNRLEDMVKESYSNEFGSKICAYGILRQFMVELNRFSMKIGYEMTEQKNNSPLVSNVLQYIGEHYNEELSLDRLAKTFYVSKYHLSHEFSKEMGVGICRYITLKRLLSARQLLAEGVPAGEASVRCGFRDYTNFYRAFKGEYGISPADVLNR